MKLASLLTDTYRLARRWARVARWGVRRRIMPTIRRPVQAL